MSFSVGIVGLPNAGKSTLFKALTRKPVDIAPYPFTTIKPNVGVLIVPDERLEKIAEIIKPEKTVPTVIEFVDIAGLVRGAHKGEGLGNQFLAQIRECDAILQVVRAFGENPSPDDDIEIVKTELELKDLESKEQENLLSKKPVIYLFNVDDKAEVGHTMSNRHRMSINLKLEAELSELSEAEKKELNLASNLDQVILACYNILDLITFYTITGFKETRAWTIKGGASAPDAGNKVHSDFKDKFIKAEVVSFGDLTGSGGWNMARENGLIKTVGKEYLVQDGDIIEFKI